MKRTLIILAAGKGTRMKSPLPKVLHPLLGRPMLAHLLEATRTLQFDETAVVVGHGAERVEALLAPTGVKTVLQEPQLGTGHALMACEKFLRDSGESECMLVAGDVPLLPVEEALFFRERFHESGAKAAVVAIDLPDPTGYGRILTSDDETVDSIVEERDATEREKRLTWVNSGAYFFKSPWILDALKEIGNDNSQGEYYLTDIFARLKETGEAARLYRSCKPKAWLGVNTQAQLADMTDALRRSVVEEWMERGVVVMDTKSTWIETQVKLGAGVVLQPYVRLCGKTTIGGGVEIRSFSTITDCSIGADSLVKEHCVLEKTVTGKGCSIGPFSRTREGTVLEEDVRLGNFVETKKAHLESGVKASHLSYLGDAAVGEGSNIGAGTITCNYDGVNKNRTVLGKNVFIGSDTQLVAPVTVGDGAYVGAGTTVTKEVPPGSLAVSRTPQKNIQGWVERKKENGNASSGER